MICILLSDDGSLFRVIDPDTKKDITKEKGYECNAFTIQTTDGRYKTGFHIGVDCTEEVKAEQSKALDKAAKVVVGAAADEDSDGEGFIGDGRPSSTDRDGGRYDRG